MSTVTLPAYEEVMDIVLSHIRPAGTERAGVINTPGRTLAEDIAADGRVLLPKGTVIGGSEMGLLAEIGVPGVRVSRRPRVSIITTGDGVVDLLEDLAPGNRRNVNRYSLAGRVFSTGCEIGRLVHASDSPESVRSAMNSVRASDVVIITDGTSGLAHEAVDSYDLLMEGAAMDPGESTAFALLHGKPAIFLRGDACSAAVVFELMVRPALFAILGRSEVRHPVVRGLAEEPFRHDGRVKSFVPAVAAIVGGQMRVRPMPVFSMADLSRSNCISVIPEQVESIEVGEGIDIMLTGPPNA